MVRLPETPECDLNEMNQSELVALCQWIGIKASRAWPREFLTRALENFETYELPDPIGERHTRMSTWLKKYWDRAQMQAKKKSCPNCEYCRDMQVLECYYANKKNIEGR